MKNLCEWFLKFRRRWKLSTQITLTYALILFVTMILIGAGMTAGVYYSFYHQAERAIEYSIERTTQTAAKLETVDATFFSRGTVMPSVIFRVTDESGKIILNSNPHFWENEKILSRARPDPPFWSNKNFTLIETNNSFLYYKDLPLKIGGKMYHFHFIRLITFEKKFIRNLLMLLFNLGLAGMALAIWFGHVLGRRVLSPLAQVTETAREISAGSLDRRLKIENDGDEVNELSVTFNKMLDRLEESFAQQQKFIADASHELRTPITIARGYVDMLENYGAEDKELFNESVAAIKNSTQNMQYLVENLLFLARADQGTQPLDKIPLELDDVLRAAVDSFKNPRVEFTGVEPFETFGDANFLGKMFAAFIDNALTFSTGKVIVSAKISGDAAEVKISDSGIGIAPENLDKIFDRFFKVDAARTRTDDEKISAGLGLSIAKWIADQHGIKIDVESEPDAGTTFTLTVPR